MALTRDILRRAGSLDRLGVDEYALDPKGYLRLGTGTTIDAAGYIATGARVVNVMNEGASPFGVVSSSTAITAAVTAALTSNSIAGVGGGTAYRTVVVEFPAGTFVDDVAHTFTPTTTATSGRDRQRIIMRGAADGSTVIRMGAAGGWTFAGMMVSVQNIRFVGGGANPGLVSLGAAAPSTIADAVNQVDIAHCEFHDANTWLKLNYCYDGTIRDCLFQNVAAGQAGIDMPANGFDNCNNVNFYRAHCQGAGVGSTLMRFTGASAAGKQHGRLGFFGCHWETSPSPDMTSINIDLTYCTSVGFYACQITQNGVTPNLATLPASVRLVSCAAVKFEASAIGRTDVGPFTNPLFWIGGTTTGVTADTCRFSLNENPNGNKGKTALWASDPTVPYTGAGDPLFLVNCMFDIASEIATGNDAIYFNDATSRNKRWRQYLDGSTSLAFDYNASLTSLASGLVANLRLKVDGSVALGTFLELTELAADPAAPPANGARLYLKDNGSGKTQLCVRFPTGAVVVLGVEP